jgi:hypothetical protein
MTKKTRLIILVFCVVCFFVIAPILVAYSMGYRFDFEKMKIVATGGIYVKVLPQNAEVIVDSKFNKKTSLFLNSVLVQNLLPKRYSILIKKDGYFPYQKTLEVKEKEVTKLEHVILIKEKISFEILRDKSNSPFLEKPEEELFVIKNGNLYKNTPAQSQPILKKLLSFEISGNNIIWLGLDGILYSSSQDGKITDTLSQTPLKINKNNPYKFTIISQNIFLQENDKLLLFNQKTKSFEVFYSPVKDLKISPDQTKLLYYNDYEILYSYLNSDNPEKIFLNRFSEKIGDCFWLNDNYLVFNLGDKIIISEIDNRGSINMVNFPQNISLIDDKTIEIKNPKIIFNQRDKKLYISTKDNILVSEPLIP